MPTKRHLIAGLVAAVVASVLGFVAHVGSREWIQNWVTSQMAGRQVMPSWDVRYLAGVTSLETGIGIVLVYAMVRPMLPARSSAGRGTLVAVLLLAVTGRLFRQPVMDAAIGNPVPVVMIQDGSTWVVWLLMCIAAACVFDKANAGEPVVGAMPPAPAALECLRDLEAIPAFLLANDAGFQQPPSEIELRKRETAFQTALREAKTVQDDAQCADVLQRYVAAWRKGHLFVVPFKAGEPAGALQTVPQKMMPRLEILSPTTALVTIPSFFPPAREPLAVLLERHRAELLSRENWIIDVRGNGGGNDTTYAPLLPWLMSDGWIEVSERVFVTPANIRAQEQARELLAPGDSEGERIVQATLQRMRAAKVGSWVQNVYEAGWRYERPAKLEPQRPRKVAVLLDARCGSSCEQFLLTVRQSFSVKLVGHSSSGGATDASNLRSHLLPSGKRQLWYATTLSNRVPGLRIDGVGVSPDVFLPGEPEADPHVDVIRAQRWLENGGW